MTNQQWPNRLTDLVMGDDEVLSYLQPVIGYEQEERTHQRRDCDLIVPDEPVERVDMNHTALSRVCQRCSMPFIRAANSADTSPHY